MAKKYISMRVALAMGLLGSLLVAGPTTLADVTSKPRIVYVFKDDLGARDGFKSLLSANGFNFRGLHVDEVSAFDFSGADLILVGPDTNAGYSGFSSPKAAEALDSTQLPVFAVGRGGSMLLDVINPSLGYGGSANSETNMVTPLRVGDSIWKGPFDIKPKGRKRLFNRPSWNAAVWEGTPTQDVWLFAQSFDDYYQLAMAKAADDQATFLWGYQASPSALTAVGRKVFVNSVVRLLDFAS